jgi:hypothetical protein
MKRLHIQSILASMFVAGIALIGNWSTALAQNGEYYRSPVVADKGHWQLSTNYITRSTVIRFYDREERVIYEETLPGKYIKLTEQNMETIDQAFNRLMNNRLVLDEVTPIALPEANFTASSRAHTLSRDLPAEPTAVASNAKRLGITFFKLIHRRAFKLVFINPFEDNVFIRLKNELGEAVYNEVAEHAKEYSRVFDLSSLEDGIYTFEIANTHEKQSRRVRLSSRKEQTAEIFPSFVP